MNSYITGQIIKELRQKQGLTQEDLAIKLSVSDKTISKWGTGRGLPDITLLEPLSQVLRLSVIELLSGKQIANKNISCNLKRGHFYVCPICGNVIFSIGNSVISCCGINLPKIDADDAQENVFNINNIDNEYYITVSHEMTKKHYVSFIAYVTDNKCDIVKLYPEQDPEAYFRKNGHGIFYFYCNKDGLFKTKNI